MALKLAKQIRGEIKTSFAKNSLFYYNFEEIKIQPEIVIIGAGRRVREDVLPVFETLKKNNETISIFAKNESGIFGLIKPYLVQPLKDLSSSDVSLK